jgi:tetratricopeptide (TPR) repeat protein
MKAGAAARAIVVVVALMTPAAAQPTTGAPAPDAEAKARAEYEQGTTHFNLGEYAEAAEAFRRAYELSKAPGLLFNLGQAHRLRGGPGSCKAALLVYESYVRLDPNGRFRASAEKYIAEMQACAKAEAESAAAAPPPAPPPKPEERIVIVERPVESTGNGMRVAGWVSLAVGGAGLIAGTTTGVLAMKKGSDLEGPCSQGCPPALHDDNNTYNALRTWTTVGLAVGGVGVITGAVLLWSARGRESAATASISVSPGGAGIQVRGVF